MANRPVISKRWNSPEIPDVLLIILAMIWVMYEEVAAGAFTVRQQKLWKLVMIQLIIHIWVFFCFFYQSRLIFGLFTMLCWCSADTLVMTKRLNRPRQIQTDLQAHKQTVYLSRRNTHTTSEWKIKMSVWWKVWFIAIWASLRVIQQKQLHLSNFMTTSSLTYQTLMCKLLSLHELLDEYSFCLTQICLWRKSR